MSAQLTRPDYWQTAYHLLKSPPFLSLLSLLVPRQPALHGSLLQLVGRALGALGNTNHDMAKGFLSIAVQASATAAALRPAGCRVWARARAGAGAAGRGRRRGLRARGLRWAASRVPDLLPPAAVCSPSLLTVSTLSHPLFHYLPPTPLPFCSWCLRGACLRCCGGLRSGSRAPTPPWCATSCLACWRSPPRPTPQTLRAAC